MALAALRQMRYGVTVWYPNGIGAIFFGAAAFTFFGAAAFTFREAGFDFAAAFDFGAAFFAAFFFLAIDATPSKGFEGLYPSAMLSARSRSCWAPQSFFASRSPIGPHTRAATAGHRDPPPRLIAANS